MKPSETKKHQQKHVASPSKCPHHNRNADMYVLLLNLGRVIATLN